FPPFGPHAWTRLKRCDTNSALASRTVGLGVRVCNAASYRIGHIRQHGSRDVDPCGGEPGINAFRAITVAHWDHLKSGDLGGICELLEVKVALGPRVVLSVVTDPTG